MKTNKLLKQLDHEFSEAAQCQNKYKKGLKQLVADIQSLEKELRKKLKQESKKSKRKLLKQKLNKLNQAHVMLG